jgi:hypothetical protein
VVTPQDGCQFVGIEEKTVAVGAAIQVCSGAVTECGECDFLQFLDTPGAEAGLARDLVTRDGELRQKRVGGEMRLGCCVGEISKLSLIQPNAAALAAYIKLHAAMDEGNKGRVATGAGSDHERMGKGLRQDLSMNHLVVTNPVNAVDP